MRYSRTENGCQKLFLVKCDLHNVRFAGRGAFGRVSSGQHRETGQWRAIKVQSHNLREVKQEAAHQRKVGGAHHTLPRLLDHYEVYRASGSRLGVIEMEHGGRSLADTRRRLSVLDHQKHIYCDKLPVKTAAAIVLKVLDGLQAMHGKRFVHLDLQPKNVLWDGSKPESVKMVDFGTVEALHHTGEPKGGTWEYMPPEQFGRGPFTEATDLFQAVALLIYLTSGRAPFIAWSRDGVKGLHNDGGRNSAIGSCPQELHGLLHKHLRFRGHLRPTLQELREDLQWFC
uniref:Protein kinase domain-containing protein n=1 Tax=Chromera velia CCMP2878 TaxID=1169474 RepID=A0A0G4G856_9ALVE|eukprot:Cvel_4328.t1-p1 / transcript=Cvel_4328.t1 / gene=Cvel_4328 / organism=Chromera_velia_CCMP2878 / gene_product=Serine/threonine-protein kinase 17B, putative / transcript_product=Serine/threonine-protein kinase 17B, putative / location=Cvel_scaffold187:111442-112293(-) / protein_length=284 / sequence_SO=supercontig / SO=protein_coding / is_pseudo=false